jgi:hypothetical protein
VTEADPIGTYLGRFVAPYGGAADRRAHELALAYLLEHADEAHPRLLDMLGTANQPNPVVVIMALPSFGRAASIPVLAELLAKGRPNVRMAAADALGRHPLPAALSALEHALSASDPAVVSAAADGLRTRGDSAACAPLRAVFGHPDAGARYHVLRAAAGLGCLSLDALRALTQHDLDPDIRGLAAELKRSST